MFHTRSKIVCTIGPSINDVEKMVSCILEGMNVARINFSHGTHEEHRKTIVDLRAAAKTTGQPLSIMLDTKGPEIRVGAFDFGEIQLKAKEHYRLGEKGSADSRVIPVHPAEVLTSLQVGMTVLFDDGYIITRVVGKQSREVTVEVEHGGRLKSGKKINVPDASLSLPALTEEDISDLRFGCAMGIDIVAASFIRSANEIQSIRDILASEGRSDILVIAKIENAEGVKNFDSILEAADGIMVARGDLGVEMDLAIVPQLQKMMIRKCHDFAKPVVTATQMLESMIYHPRPTRAEVSDVANAIYDGSSAVMLSGETASGNFPIETIRQMRRIIEVAEKDFDYRGVLAKQATRVFVNDSSSLCVAAVQMAYSAKAKAIFAYTTSGLTARLLSRLCPEMPIVAVTSDEKVFHQLSFYWGVTPCYHPHCSSLNDAYRFASEFALRLGMVSPEDAVVVTGGSPFGRKGITNIMMLEKITKMH